MQILVTQILAMAMAKGQEAGGDEEAALLHDTVLPCRKPANKSIVNAQSWYKFKTPSQSRYKFKTPWCQNVLPGEHPERLGLAARPHLYPKL